VTAVEDTEIDLLLEAVDRVFGYDFRHYARSTVQRRVADLVQRMHLRNVSELQGKLLREPEVLNSVVSALSVQVSSFFRDPKVYLVFRQKVVPILKTYPFVRIWHAGCASGEEVYSIAILLKEEGLFDRCQIYATDINAEALHNAALGVYPAQNITASANSHRESGNSGCLADYFQIAGREARILPDLTRPITFFQHNLVTDHSFNEFHVILCRNVLIYFSKPLQDRVHKLLYDSLIRLGVLGLGTNETLHLTPKEKHYRALDEGARLYRRTD
jgi:chemotaxis protein methyltransferase CheR